MDYIIYDLEATCWENRPPSIPQETIEIGAYRLSGDGGFLAEFQAFVKPVLHPRLSNFCESLTQIYQDDVDRAATFATVAERFIDFIGYNDDEDYLLCSWGDFDALQLRRDCAVHRIDDDWTYPHINLKKQLQRIMRRDKPIGLANAVKTVGSYWEGEQHRALDDAKNLVKVFRAHIDEWIH